MGTRWVIHADELDDVDAGPLLRFLADDVAGDMRTRASALGGTGNLATGVEVTQVTSNRARISAKRPAGGGGGGEDQEQWAEEVPVFVERGTSRTRAQPFMRPALYRYRAP